MTPDPDPQPDPQQSPLDSPEQHEDSDAAPVTAEPAEDEEKTEPEDEVTTAPDEISHTPEEDHAKEGADDDELGLGKIISAPVISQGMLY